jgi:hypothetical protein
MTIATQPLVGNPSSKKSDMYDAIIIGAGMSGLVCGCYLAKAGMNEDTNKSYKTWKDKFYQIKQVMPIVAEEPDRFVVVTEALAKVLNCHPELVEGCLIYRHGSTSSP